MACRKLIALLAVGGLLSATRVDAPPVSANLAEPFDFAYDILPALEKQGCASAYCHGSAKGKGGFKLSLFGSDPEADHRAITQDLDGRRVDFGTPDASLLLRKPSLQMAHGGGKKLPKGSLVYGKVRDWIAKGAPQRTGEVALRGLKLSVCNSRLEVVATFERGRSRDVTDLAMFTSSDEAIATVDANGSVRWRGKGEVWFFARYGGHHSRVSSVRPFGKTYIAITPPSMRDQHPLGVPWINGRGKVGLQQAPYQGDRAMLRRLFLDLVDRPPTARELRLDRHAAVRALVKRPGFAAKWGRLLADWFEIPDPAAPGRNARRDQHRRIRRDLVQAVAKGVNLRDLTRQFLTTDRRLLARYADPRDRAEFVGRAFLGMRIGCARCHNHPLDRWTQAEHLSFSAFFADRRPDGHGGTRDGVLFHPDTAAAIKPALLPLGEEPVAGTSHADTIARFVLDRRHDRFARNIVNRVFREIMGQGLVEPVDDHRLSNPARNEEVLAMLTEEFDGDLRKLCEFIVTSDMYAVTSQNDPQVERAKRSVRHLRTREAVPLSSPAFRRSVMSVLGVGLPDNVRLPSSPLARQLALLNGRFLHDALAQPTTNLQAILDFTPKAEDQLREIYQLILSREPKPSERKKFLPLLEGAKGREQLSKNARDLAFALLASREFGSKR